MPASDPASVSLALAALDAAPFGVAMFDRELRFTYANSRIAEINRRAIGDHLGRRIIELTDHPNASVVETFIERAFASGRPQTDEDTTDRLQREPGEGRYFVGSYYPVGEAGGVVAVVAFVFDVSDLDRRRIEADLRRSEDRYRSIVLATSSIVWVSDPFGRLLEELPGWEAYTGQHFDDYVGEGWIDAVHPDDRGLIQLAFNAALGTPLYESQYRIWSREHDAYRTVLVRGTPRLDADGDVIEWTGVCLDIQDRVDADVALARRRANTAGLAELAAGLSAARSVEDVLGVIPTMLATAIDSVSVTVGVVDAARQLLDVRFSRPVSDAVRERYGRIDLSGDVRSIVAAVVLDGQPRWYPDLDALAAEYPHVIDDARDAGVQSNACLPIADSTGEIVGCVSVGWPFPNEFDYGLTETLSTAVRVIGEALERARLHEAEHRFAVQLQHTLVAPLRLPPAYEIASRYLPAETEMQMGGDWYDAVPLPGGRTAIVLGDVTGHGVDAAADMAQLKAMMSTLLALDTPIDETMQRASSLSRVVGRVDVMATALVIVLDPGRAELTHLSAGHPPFVVIEPSGATAVIERPRGPLIGLAASALSSPSRPASAPATIPFPPGSLLVAFTDGLVERRDTMIDDTIAMVAARVAAESSASCDRLVELIIDVAQPSRHDDLALVVIRAAL